MNILKIKEKIILILIAAVIPIFAVAVWQVTSNEGLVNKSILPGPDKIIEAFRKMIQKGTYKKHILASLGRVLKGFLIGSSAGLIIGISAGLFKRVNQVLAAVIGMLRPVPPIACIPFLILWLGIDEESKVAVIVIGSFWPVLLNTMHGIKSTEPKFLEVARVFEKNKLKILLKIIIPSAAPAIFTGLRLGISSAWTCVVTAEMIASSMGVGYLISYGRELAQPDTLFVGIISIGIIGLVIDSIVLKLQKVLLYWVALE